MANHFSPQLKHRLPLRSKQTTAGVVVIAAIGVVVLVAALAAGAYISVETETGTMSGGATVVNDTNASGGKAVKFAMAVSPTPAPAPSPTPAPGGGVTFNHCANPTYTLPTNPSNPQDGRNFGNYYLDTDTWAFDQYPGSQQTIYACDYNNWYAMVNVNDNANDGAVKTYPNIHEDFYSAAPKLTSFSSVTSTFAHTAPTYGAWDYAYDIWINGQNVELMIWTQSAGRQAHVPGVPIVASTTLSGINYNIHKSGTYIAYDMTTTHTSGNLNLLEIFKDMIAHGYVSNTATLGSIQYGVEVCDTSSINTKFELNNFSITTQ